MAKPILRAEYDAVRSLIRELRIGAEVKQVDLSEALGKPQPYISAIETGHRRVDIVEIRDICKALDLTLSDFVTKLEKAIRSPAKKVRAKRTRVG